MNQLISFINKREKLLLWLGVALYFIVFSLISTWKYYQFGYNGLDLAIYNQVFFNSAQGNLFGFTIHPQSYLGDHFELFILALLPLYYIFQHPLTLLILQTLILALSAWPIYLISKKLLPPSFVLLPPLLWLLNPFVQNINLFEFHLLPFALFFLFFAFYFYQKEKFLAFLLYCFIALLVREDVALVILMFSFLALIEKREIKWIIWPAVMAVSWFILAIQVIAYFSPGGSYKFLYYYGWLGANFKEIALNFWLKPLAVVKHVFSLNNLLFTLMLFLPLGYFNLLKLKYLFLGLLIYLQLILAGNGNPLIALKLHYPSLLLLALFIALIFSLENLLANRQAGKTVAWLRKNLNLAVIILMSSALYGFLTLGPVSGVVNKLFKPADSQEVKKLKNDFLKAIAADKNVAATYEFLTVVSGRENAYSLHYAFIGIKQFTDLTYQLPEKVDALLVNFDEFLTYSVQFPNSQQWQAYYQSGDDNIRKLIRERNLKVTKIVDSLALFEEAKLLEKTEKEGIDLYKVTQNFSDIEHSQNIEFENGVKFLGWTSLATTDSRLNTSDLNLLPISLYFQTTQKLDKNYQLKLALKNKNGQIVHEKLYPLAYGLYPTTEWQTDEVVKINYWFLIPKSLPADEYRPELSLINFKGLLTLNGIRSAVMDITSQKELKPAIELDNYRPD